MPFATTRKTAEQRRIAKARRHEDEHWDGAGICVGA